MISIQASRLVMPRTLSRKEATHERIVDVASRAIRRSGYGGTGVADTMKEASLTHGGFCAHFRSRDALLAEAADCAGAQGVEDLGRIAADAPEGERLETLLRAYLSREHVAQAELGWLADAVRHATLAGLGVERR